MSHDWESQTIMRKSHIDYVRAKNDQSNTTEKNHAKSETNK